MFNMSYYNVRQCDEAFRQNDCLAVDLADKIGKSLARPVRKVYRDYFRLDLPKDTFMDDVLKKIPAKKVYEMNKRVFDIIESTAKKHNLQMIQSWQSDSGYYFRKM